MRAKTRINITVDRETVHLADRLARRMKTSRSAVMREGVRALAETKAREVDDQTRCLKQREAFGRILRFAHEAGDWPAERIVRAWRDRLGRSA